MIGVFKMDNYLKAHDFAERWGVSVRQIQLLCKKGRISGAVKFGNTWAIPKGTKKPPDLRKLSM